MNLSLEEIIDLQNTLIKVKQDQISHEYGYENWDDLSKETNNDNYWPEVCKRYGFEILNNTKGTEFNEGVEAVKKSFDSLFLIKPDITNILQIVQELKKVFENIEKLKKEIVQRS